MVAGRPEVGGKRLCVGRGRGGKEKGVNTAAHYEQLRLDAMGAARVLSVNVSCLASCW